MVISEDTITLLRAWNTCQDRQIRAELSVPETILMSAIEAQLAYNQAACRHPARRQVRWHGLLVLECVICRKFTG